MPDEQRSFSYTLQEMQSLVLSLSAERLQAYIASVRFPKDIESNLRQGLKLYEKNTKLCEVLYPVMQALEVTLRNAVHDRLTGVFGATWYDSIALLPSEAEAIQDAKQNILNKPQEVTAGRIVAELSFGFWVRLFSADYAITLWGPHLGKLIQPATNDRRAVYSRLIDLKTLRNRIAHHNRIVGRAQTVRQAYDLALETIGWFNLTMKDWVVVTNLVEQTLQRKPIAVRDTAIPAIKTT